MSPRPPRSTTTATLFPYTPLFRSPHGRADANWIAPLCAGEAPADGRVRLAASLLSDVAWSANPDFRAERGTEIGLYGNWRGTDIAGRILLARALHAGSGGADVDFPAMGARSAEHQSELQSLMHLTYAVYCFKNNNKFNITQI